MEKTKVLVLCATGKAGGNVCRALVEAGFQVYGTTRSNAQKLSEQGVTPVLCDYTRRESLARALFETGAKKIFVITDYFGAAKSDEARFNQGEGAASRGKGKDRRPLKGVYPISKMITGL